MKPKNIYIDNEKFYNEISEYRKKYQESIKNNTEKPIMSDYIGHCFMKIANNFSNRPNFIGYSYKDDMVGDAVEICVRFAHNFDPEQSKNPFSYFTQVVFFSFIQRIAKEKKQQELKYKMIEVCEFNFIEEKSEENEEMKQYLLENMRKMIDSKNTEFKSTKKNIKKDKKINKFNMFE